ncbi:hypothetical protein CBS147346_8850 [Aspergillus niger]|nr:hypothetical protein CBS147346_8850 [Aspergillus niger]
MWIVRIIARGLRTSPHIRYLEFTKAQLPSTLQNWFLPGAKLVSSSSLHLSPPYIHGILGFSATQHSSSLAGPIGS